MTKPAPVHAEQALDELVNQFSDPMSFLRELVQNSLDAGSSEVEVNVDWEAGDGGDGVAVIRVEDWGEGMTREIIETRLTRLFSSAKDGDMTKIGKFGIGFVSVFALSPDAVCVDTSRDGENWRVLFDAQRHFQLLRLERPVDGTKIRIYKSATRAEASDLAKRARAALEYWCRHTAGEIRFGTELINCSLGLDAPCCVVHDDGFSRIVVGHPADGRSFFGFYNTGLTLIEGGDELMPGLAFKISSPHLEHTLTRDNVIRDAGFDRVMDTLSEVVDTRLANEVFDRLEQALDQPVDHGTLRYLYRAAGWHLARGDDAVLRTAQRVLFCLPSGRRLTVGSCKRTHREQEVLVAEFRSPLTDALEQGGSTVVWAVGGEDARTVLAGLLPQHVRVRDVDTTYAMPVVASEDAESERWRPLCRAVAELLRDYGAKVSAVYLGHFAYPGSAIAAMPAIVQREVGVPTKLEDVRALGTGFFSWARPVVVNADHPAVVPLVSLASTEPELAAYMVIKLFFLGETLDDEIDGRLAASATEQRWRRSRT